MRKACSSGPFSRFPHLIGRRTWRGNMERSRQVVHHGSRLAPPTLLISSSQSRVREVGSPERPRCRYLWAPLPAWDTAIWILFLLFETLRASNERKRNCVFGGPAIEVPDPRASILIVPAWDGLLPLALASTGRVSARSAFSRIRTTSPAPGLWDGAVSASEVRCCSTQCVLCGRVPLSSFVRWIIPFVDARQSHAHSWGTCACS